MEELYEHAKMEHIYTVSMVQESDELGKPYTVQDEVRATSELDAILLMKEALFTEGFDDNEISVVSATKVIHWT